MYKMYGIFAKFSSAIFTHLETFFIKDYKVLFSPAYTKLDSRNKQERVCSPKDRLVVDSIDQMLKILV